MRKLMLTTSIAALLAGPAIANAADLISIGLQESGTNGGAITTETSASEAATLGATDYGTFHLNQATAQDTAGIGLPALLNSNSLNTSSDSAGVLKVWITAQGLTDPVGITNILSSFTANDLTGSITSVEEQTFLDAGNGLYTTTTPLGSAAFTAIGTSSPPAVLEDLASPFSITEEYTITAMGQGNTNLTIDTSVDAVPEPASMALLGSGLLGLGAMRRRRKATAQAR